MIPKVILASSSPWRRDLFRLYFPSLFHSEAVTFLAPDIDEASIRHDDPRQMVLDIAEAKCDLGVLAKINPDADLIITCDQVVLCLKEVREKPKDEDEARAFLLSYSEGATAECINGLVVHHVASGRRVKAVESSKVSFKPFPSSVGNEIIRSGIAFKTAGAFSISEYPLAKFIDRIEGNVPSVEGLPIDKLQEMMRQFYPDLPPLLPALGKIRFVLFDMDGLLLDTETFYTIANQRILDRFGIQFTREVKAMMMGRKALEATQLMIEHYEIGQLVTAEDFVREREEILDSLFPNSDLMPGVERLLKHLHRHNIPMAIATSSHKRHFQMKTERHESLFQQVFHHSITADDIKNSKPNPEIFLTALNRFHPEEVDMGEVLVFEDSPLGIEAALAAKMKAVQVSDMKPGNEQTPDLHICNLLYFLPEQWGLPPFE